MARSAASASLLEKGHKIRLTRRSNDGRRFMRRRDACKLALARTAAEWTIVVEPSNVGVDVSRRAALG